MSRPVALLGVEVPLKDEASRHAFCVVGLVAAFVVQNFLQEYTFAMPGFRYGTLMAFVEFATCAALAGVERKATGTASVWDRTRTLVEYAALSLVLPLSSASGTSALAHVNMPVKVIFKSSKLLPTMLVGRLVNGTRYSAWDVGSAAALCLGVAAFTLADASVSPHFDSWGVALLLMAVVLDAAVPNCQQRLMAGRATAVTPQTAVATVAASKLEVMFYTNLIGAAIIGASLLWGAEGAEGVAFCAANPAAVTALLLYGASTYVGISFYITTVKRYGAVSAITVTTLRKILTLMVSFVYFGHSWSVVHVLSAAAVLGLGCIKIKGQTTAQATAAKTPAVISKELTHPRRILGLATRRDSPREDLLARFPSRWSTS